MNDNIINLNEAQTEPTPHGVYPLDWKTTEIRMGKGRFTHTLRRPTAEELFKREDRRQSAIPIAKDGSYGMPDPTLAEAANAELYDAICVEASGYTSDVPQLHKSLAVENLWAKREYSVPDDADVFGDEVPVLEEIGGDIDADFTVRHILRQPTEGELSRYRGRASQNIEIKPGKRGRQQLVSKANLRALAAFYDQWIVRIEGAAVGGRTWSGDARNEFIECVDPITKRAVVGTFIDKLTDELSD